MQFTIPSVLTSIRHLGGPVPANVPVTLGTQIMTINLGTVVRGQLIIGSFYLAAQKLVDPGDLIIMLRRLSGSGAIEFAPGVFTARWNRTLAASEIVETVISFQASVIITGTLIFEIIGSSAGSGSNVGGPSSSLSLMQFLR